MGLRLAGAAPRYSSDYSNPQLRPAFEASLHVQVNPAWSLFATGGRGRLAAGVGGSSFDQAFDYAEAGALLRLLPRDRLTPYLLAGGGVTRRELRTDTPYNTLPHAVVGVGLEYLVTNRLGLSAQLDNHLYFNDQLDLLARGSYNDYYWGARVGAVLYLGRLGRPTGRTH